MLFGTARDLNLRTAYFICESSFSFTFFNMMYFSALDDSLTSSKVTTTTAQLTPVSVVNTEEADGYVTAM